MHHTQTPAPDGVMSPYSPVGEYPINGDDQNPPAMAAVFGAPIDWFENLGAYNRVTHRYGKERVFLPDRQYLWSRLMQPKHFSRTETKIAAAVDRERRADGVIISVKESADDRPSMTVFETIDCPILVVRNRNTGSIAAAFTSRDAFEPRMTTATNNDPSKTPLRCQYTSVVQEVCCFWFAATPPDRLIAHIITGSRDRSAAIVDQCRRCGVSYVVSHGPYADTHETLHPLHGEDDAHNAVVLTWR